MRSNWGKSLWEFHTAPSRTFIVPSNARLCVDGDFSLWEFQPPHPLPWVVPGGCSTLTPEGSGATRGLFRPESCLQGDSGQEQGNAAAVRAGGGSQSHRCCTRRGLRDGGCPGVGDGHHQSSPP